MYTRRYDIDLDPFVTELQELYDDKLARARKPRKRKLAGRSYVSVNRMYPLNRFSGRKHLSDEGRLYKEYIYDCLEELDVVLGAYKLPFGFEVTYVFFMSREMLYTKAGDYKDVDVSNMLKAAEDAVFEFLVEKDSTVVSIHGHKRIAEVPKLVVLLSAGSATDDIVHAGVTVSAEELYSDATVFQSSLQC